MRTQDNADAWMYVLECSTATSTMSPLIGLASISALQGFMDIGPTRHACRNARLAHLDRIQLEYVWPNALMALSLIPSLASVRLDVQLPVTNMETPPLINASQPVPSSPLCMHRTMAEFAWLIASHHGIDWTPQENVCRVVHPLHPCMLIQ